MEEDPIVDPIREARHQISARFGHDPKRLVEHYMRLDQEDPDQLTDPAGHEKPTEESSEEHQ